MGFLSDLWPFRKKKESRVVVFIGQEGNYLDHRPYDPDEDDDKAWVKVGDGKVLVQRGNPTDSAGRPLQRRARLSQFAFKEFDYYNVDSGTVYDDAKFREITAGAFVDTPLEAHNRIVKLALLQYKKNARAFSIVEVVKDFTLGDGVIIDAADPRVQEIIDEFWEVNEWEDKLEERVRALAVTGEQLYPIFVGDDGILHISSILPLQILEVLRNTENAEDLQQVKACVRDLAMDYRTDSVVMDADAECFKILKPRDAWRIANGKMDLRDEKFCLFFAVNRIAGGTRGQPDITPVIDWIEGMDSFLFTMLERADLALQVVFDLKCDGLDAPKLRDMASEFVKSLRAGEVYAHNEKVTLDVHSPTLGSAEAEEIFNVLSRMISAGVGLPGMFFGDSMDIARASASEMTIPPSKRLQSRQRFVKRMIQRCLDLQIAWTRAKTPDRLKGVEDFTYQIRMPKIMLRDMSVTTRSIKGLADALSSALDREDPFITPELAQKIFVNALIDLDPAEDYLQAYSKASDRPSTMTAEDEAKLSPELYDAYQKVKFAKAEMRMARSARRASSMPHDDHEEEDGDE